MGRAPGRRRAARRTAGALVILLALPLAGCALPRSAGDLARAGCPSDIRIQTDDLPRVEWGFLYGLLDPGELEVGDGEVTAPLVVDGDPTGVTLTILTGDADDGVSANVDLYDDDDLLLAAVDTDAAIIDAVRYPAIGVFAPTARDSQFVYWDAEIYPGVRSVEGVGDTLTPAGDIRVPVIATPGDPFYDYLVGDGILRADEILPDYAGSIQTFLDAGGVSAQQGDALVDPYLLALPTGSPRETGSQLIDDAGYTRDAGVLSARPESLPRYADCLELLVPILQQSLVDYLDSPDATTELIVELSAEFGDATYDAALAATAFAALTEQRIVDNGRDDTIGDLDIGRVRQLFEDVVPAWAKAGLSIPAGLEPEDVVTDEFIDHSIGL